MKFLLGYWLVGVALVTLTQAAVAQGGDVRAGFAYAGRVCTECHAVRRGERVSPHERAPAFQEVSEAPGMTEMAFRVWFQTSHPSMPNLIIKDKEAADVIAYILSLRQRS
jgi:mono/diheme cytochrome c family protein